METFLAEVARSLYEEHPNDLDQVTVVFNNRRSGLFLRRQFAKLSDKPFFLPRIIGIDELVAELGDLEIVPNEFLLFELFDIHRHIGDENRKYNTFEDFISFGDMMLADFSQIDLYRVDADQLFSNLHEIKEIGEWNVETGELTPGQKQYLKFYKSLYQYYTQFRERLLSQGKAYSGMAYRYVAENIEQLAQKTDCKEIYFVGFNALSTCEHDIIKEYVKLGKGKLYTDGDAYYFNDANQEAGHFLRRHQGSDIPIEKEYPDHFAQDHKDITIVNCPENVLQCKYVGQLLAEQVRNNPDNPIEETAVVLADESLLLPMLNSLPPEIKTANITMGYPFTNTAVYSLVVKLFSLQKRRKQEYFYHQDILDILSDLCITKTLGISNVHSKITKILTEDHFIYANLEEISSIGTKLGCDISPISFIFTEEMPTPDEFLALVERLTVLIYNTEALNGNRKEKEALACLLEIIHYFQQLQTDYHFVDNLNVLVKIFTRLAQRRSVAFYGEPLKGLQILGVLETRNLDFKRVILVSADEGTLPSGKESNTLIPYNLKTAFGIPTFHEKDAVYAYNFYRLIQRADQVHLIYHTEADSTGKGAPSRFILQVRRELAKRYPQNITLREEVLSSVNGCIPNLQKLAFPKNEQVMQKLMKLAEKGFSPSALNKYRNCPLSYYYQYVLDIRENDSISEELEQSELGSHIHAVLQKIYTTDLGHPLQKSTIQDALDNIDTLLQEDLDKEYQHGRSHVGKNHFLEAVAKTQITHLLRHELDCLKKGDAITILELEKELPQNLSVNINGKAVTVKIKGVADRIDQCNNITRIIDYKTGKVDEKDLKVDTSEPKWDEVSDKWFQIMLYTWLYNKVKNDSSQHLAGIYSLGRLNTDLFTASWEKNSMITSSQMDTFEEMLRSLIAGILNPEIPFIANYGCKSCAYCPFAETCNFNQVIEEKSSIEPTNDEE